jgi:polysaccharide biosynthesis transport protein
MEQAQLREALEADMITIVERAVPEPLQAQQFSLTLYLTAVAAALMMGLLLASTFEHFDTRLYTSKDIETTAQTQVLAKLPKTHPNHLYISKNGVSPMAESVRHLAARLQRTNIDKPHNTLVITGAEAGQGATMTAANLGMALAEQGKHVALVDLNVRDPNLHLLFDLPNEKGVMDVLAGTKGLDDALQFITGETFALLSTGPVPISALQAFDHAQLGSLLSILRQRFDYVVVDAPPVEIANIAAIAPHADELILVTRRSHIRRESLQAAGEFLSGFKEKYIGLVVNENET